MVTASMFITLSCLGGLRWDGAGLASDQSRLTGTDRQNVKLSFLDPFSSVTQETVASALKDDLVIEQG